MVSITGGFGGARNVMEGFDVMHLESRTVLSVRAMPRGIPLKGGDEF
jgi:hypothetical protein